MMFPQTRLGEYANLHETKSGAIMQSDGIHAKSDNGFIHKGITRFDLRIATLR